MPLSFDRQIVLHIQRPDIYSLVDILSRLQAIYNSLNWNPQLGDSSKTSFLTGAYGSVRSLVPSGVFRGGGYPDDGIYALSNLPTDSGPNVLVLESADPTSSINITLSGLGEALLALFDLIIPARRRIRTEEARHLTILNAGAEESQKLDNHLKSLEVFRQRQEIIFSGAREGFLSFEEAHEAIRTLYVCQDRLGAQLNDLGVEGVSWREIDLSQRPEGGPLGG